MKYSTLIFDLDGTLIDSEVDIATSVNWTLTEHGVDPLPLDLVRQYVGYGVRPLIKDTLVEMGVEKPDDAIQMFADHYFENCVRQTTLFQNVKETLLGLDQASKFILTNKSNRYVSKIVTAMGIETLFIESFGQESFAKTKPDPMPILGILEKYNLLKEKTLMVGDTEADILSGQRAGVDTCLVTYGFGNMEYVRSLKPTYVISNFQELSNLVK